MRISRNWIKDFIDMSKIHVGTDSGVSGSIGIAGDGIDPVFGHPGRDGLLIAEYGRRKSLQVRRGGTWKGAI